MAPVVVFLASDAARMVSGATYDVTAGDSARNKRDCHAADVHSSNAIRSHWLRLPTITLLRCAVIALGSNLIKVALLANQWTRQVWLRRTMPCCMRDQCATEDGVSLAPEAAVDGLGPALR